MCKIDDDASSRDRAVYVGGFTNIPLNHAEALIIKYLI